MSGLEFTPVAGPDGPPSPVGDAGATGGRRLRAFWFMTGLLALGGLGAAGVGAAGLAAAAGRHPTKAQITAAGQREQAVLWERLSAGQIFPLSVRYLSTLGEDTKATLVGIAPQAPCRSAVDANAALVLAAAGCVTMLRATYADASGTALATIGIAVLPTPAAAAKAMGKLAASGGGVLPLSFPGTVASAFTIRARETDASQAAGPYLFFYAAGYADGRSTTLGPRQASSSQDSYTSETVTTDLGTSLLTSLLSTFQVPANPCTDRNIRC
jgi:hypothetical protein